MAQKVLKIFKTFRTKWNKCSLWTTTCKMKSHSHLLFKALISIRPALHKKFTSSTNHWLDSNDVLFQVGRTSGPIKFVKFTKKSNKLMCFNVKMWKVPYWNVYFQYLFSAFSQTLKSCSMLSVMLLDCRHDWTRLFEFSVLSLMNLDRWAAKLVNVCFSH